MKQNKHRAILAIMLTVLLLTGVTMVSAFAEEDIYFLLPDVAAPDNETDDLVSIVHNDLSYVLAITAGFSEADARKIQIFDQLVDSEQLGPVDNPDIYSNCIGQIKPAPVENAAALGCPADTDFTSVTWPMWDAMTNTQTCATSRFGPYSPFFHFPHNTPDELGALHDWGWGYTDRLMGYGAYAWDAPAAGLILRARCTYKQYEEIDTGMEAGSLEAFGTYLHSMADYYSHRDCLTALAQLETPAPWGVHTLRKPNGDPNIYACDYNPDNLRVDDAHGREFGSAYPEDSARTDLALQMMYTELSRRSLWNEGIYYPLAMNTPLTIEGLPAGTTLQSALEAVVHTWDYNGAEERRALTDKILAAILTIPRRENNKIYLPVLTR